MTTNEMLALIGAMVLGAILWTWIREAWESWRRRRAYRPSKIHFVEADEPPRHAPTQRNETASAADEERIPARVANVRHRRNRTKY